MATLLQMAEDCCRCAQPQRRLESNGHQCSCATLVGRSVPASRLIGVFSEGWHRSHVEPQPPDKMPLDDANSDKPPRPTEKW